MLGKYFSVLKCISLNVTMYHRGMLESPGIQVRVIGVVRGVVVTVAAIGAEKVEVSTIGQLTLTLRTSGSSFAD